MSASSVAATVGTWGRMVRFSHSLFALPFALSGAVLAAVGHGVTTRQVLWILVAMIAARNAAMGFNRLVDQEIDRRNPRTSGRELPSGRLSRPAVWTFTVLLCALFVFASFQLGALCGALAPVALLVVLGYSYTKRFTWLSHVVLGLALAIAPIGGWLAVRGTLALAPLLLAGAVLLWVAGFDVIYATQDTDFDRAEGLHSVPARFGIATALRIARALHAGTLALLAAVGIATALHPIYWLGLAAIGALLVHEHRLVRPDDLSKLGLAFFRMNGVIGVVYLATILAAVALGRSAS